MIQALSISEIQYLAHSLARELMHGDEPIPPFETRFPQKLESCLETPFQTFGKKPLYRSFLKKSAVLFYLLIKNHPFQNGNKRIAVTSVLIFLKKNGHWLKVSNQELYNFSIWVAQSPPSVRTETIEAIEKFFQQHLIVLSQSK